MLNSVHDVGARLHFSRCVTVPSVHCIFVQSCRSMSSQLIGAYDFAKVTKQIKMETLEGSKTVHEVSQNSSDLPEEFQFNMSWVRCLNENEFLVQLSPQNSLFALVISGVFTCLLSLIGTFGNLEFVSLLRHPEVCARGQSVAGIWTALAVWDTILLLSVNGYYSVGIIWKHLFGNVPNAFLHSMMIFHPLSAASFTASSMLVAALTIQRMFAVQRPLRPRQLSFRRSPISDSQLVAQFQFAKVNQ